jgi:hypothetical protein
MYIICLFFPGALALKYSIKEKDKPYMIIAEYAKYTILINLIILACLLVFIDPHLLTNEYLFTIRFTTIYLIAGSILAIILPKVIGYIKNNITLTIKRNKR